MTLNVYLGCTIILIVAVAGMMIGVFAARKRKSKLWLAPVFSLSMTVFVSIFMYFLFAGTKLVISPWAAILFIFSEAGALLGCYMNENMEPKSNLIRAFVIILSVVIILALFMTIMFTIYEYVITQV